MTDTSSYLAEDRENSRNGRLTTWFEVWHGSMHRWVSHRCSMQGADVDDVAQEVFLRLLRYSDDSLVENPQSYLFRIATNVANEWRERARNSLPHDNSWLDDLQIEPHDEPENSVEREFTNERVRTAIGRLPQRQQEVMLLHVIDGLTRKQIADRLDLTLRIVRRDLARAYAQLRWELHTMEVDGSQSRVG
jgi:RNA polymerase sigma-70 factor (ECF subfamily)